MKRLIIILFFVLVLTMATGFYFRYVEEYAIGDHFIGFTILAAIFLLMPLFLYHRWKDRKVKDYMLTEDNIKKMRDFSEGKNADK